MVRLSLGLQRWLGGSLTWGRRTCPRPSGDGSQLVGSLKGETKAMTLITANELKRKQLITVDSQPYVVLEVFFASPTARGAATMVRTRLRQLLTGAVMEKSFRSSEKFAEPDIETVPASFLYHDAEGCHFMDEKSFEQFVFSNEKIGRASCRE